MSHNPLFSHKTGFTLVEMLIALSLMSFVAMSLVLALTKVNTMGSSLSQRNRAVLEVQAAFNKIRDSIAGASKVDPKSVSSKIVLHAMDSSKNAYLQSYRIMSQNLEYSGNLQDASETSATWESPYNIATASGYKITSGEFLYCGYGPNNCYRFPDGNNNRRWDGTGTDGAIAWVSLNGSAQGTALTSPEQAKRVVLYNFTFDRQYGNPAVKRTLPNTSVRLGKRLVETGAPKTAWTDTNPLVQQYSGTVLKSDFTNVRGLYYDHSRQRLVAVGDTTSGNRVYLFSRDGVNVKDVSNGITSPVSLSILPVDEITLESDGYHALALDDATSGTVKVYRINLKTGAVETELNLGPSAAGGNDLIKLGDVHGIAYDPSDPGYFYLMARTPANVKKIFRINISNRNDNSSWDMPASLADPVSMFMEPVTGDFYILDNVQTISGSDRTIKVFRIDRSNTTATDTFLINMGKLPGTTTANVNRTFAYDFANNRLFYCESGQNQIHEFVPSKLISPRN